MHLIWVHRIFWNKTKIFTVMCFVEPIVRLYAIHYLNTYVYSLFAELILLDTIYLLKFFAKLFLPHNSYPVVIWENMKAESAMWFNGQKHNAVVSKNLVSVCQNHFYCSIKNFSELVFYWFMLKLSAICMFLKHLRVTPPTDNNIP